MEDIQFLGSPLGQVVWLNSGYFEITLTSTLVVVASRFFLPKMIE